MNGTEYRMNYLSRRIVMDYTVDDYNVTVKRGFVRDDGMVLWGIRKYKEQRLLEWRTRKAYDKAVKQKNDARQRRFVLQKFLVGVSVVVCRNLIGLRNLKRAFHTTYTLTTLTLKQRPVMSVVW
jgi:hypothetical protein